MSGPKRAVPMSSCFKSCEFLILFTQTSTRTSINTSPLSAIPMFQHIHHGRPPAHANPEPTGSRHPDDFHNHDTTHFQQFQEFGWGTRWCWTHNATARLASPEAWICLAFGTRQQPLQRRPPRSKPKRTKKIPDMMFKRVFQKLVELALSEQIVAAFPECASSTINTEKTSRKASRDCLRAVGRRRGIGHPGRGESAWPIQDFRVHLKRCCCVLKSGFVLGFNCRHCVPPRNSSATSCRRDPGPPRYSPPQPKDAEGFGLRRGNMLDLYLFGTFKHV